MPTLQIAIDASKARAGARQFDQSARRVQRSAKGVGTSVDRMGSSFFNARVAMIAAASAGGFLAIALGGKLLRSVARLSKSFIEVAGSAVEIESKFRAVFKDEVPRTTATLDELGERVGRSNVKLKEYASSFQDTLVPMGIARDEAARMSETLVELAIDVASFNNAQDPEAVRRFQSAIVGNSEAVLKYGINLKESEVQAAALRLGLITSKRQLTETEKVLARISLLYRGTADAQGDATRTAGSWENQMKRLNDEIFDQRRLMGDQLIPAIQDAIEDFGGMDAVVASIALTFQLATTTAKGFIDTAGDFGRIAREMGLTTETLLTLVRVAKGTDLQALIVAGLTNDIAGGMDVLRAGVESAADAMFDDLKKRVLGAKAFADDALGVDTAKPRGAGRDDAVVQRQKAQQALLSLQANIRGGLSLSADERIAQIESEAHATDKMIAQLDRLAGGYGGVARAAKDYNDRLKQQRLDEEEAAAFQDENRLAVGLAGDSMRQFSSAIGSVAGGFATLEDAAEQALRSVISNLARAAAEALFFRAIIAPIFGAAGLNPGQIGSIFGNAGVNAISGSAPTKTFASGGIAHGVISQPTFFPLNGGLGLAGEAGPEIIAPAKRDERGKLGVSITDSPALMGAIGRQTSLLESIDRKMSQGSGSGQRLSGRQQSRQSQGGF